MIIRGLDQDDDWTFGNGKSSYKRSQLALNQNISTKLLEWKGDCFFDNDAGVDWKNRLEKRSQIPFLQDEIRTVILKVDGVVEVANLDLNFNSTSRNLTVNYSVKTIYSTEVESNTINV
jgi:hypothetical protein